MLVTVRVEPSARSQVIELASLYDGRIVDVGPTEVTVAIDGEPSRLDDAEELLRPYGITELQRTGRVALPKLDKGTPKLRALKGKVS